MTATHYEKKKKCKRDKTALLCQRNAQKKLVLFFFSLHSLLNVINCDKKKKKNKRKKKKQKST